MVFIMISQWSHCCIRTPCVQVRNFVRKSHIFCALYLRIRVASCAYPTIASLWCYNKYHCSVIVDEAVLPLTSDLHVTTFTSRGQTSDPEVAKSHIQKGAKKHHKSAYFSALKGILILRWVIFYFWKHTLSYEKNLFRHFVFTLNNHKFLLWYN